MPELTATWSRKGRDEGENRELGEVDEEEELEEGEVEKKDKGE